MRAYSLELLNSVQIGGFKSDLLTLFVVVSLSGLALMRIVKVLRCSAVLECKNHHSQEPKYHSAGQDDSSTTSHT